MNLISSLPEKEPIQRELARSKVGPQKKLDEPETGHRHVLGGIEPCSAYFRLFRTCKRRLSVTGPLKQVQQDLGVRLSLPFGCFLDSLDISGRIIGRQAVRNLNVRLKRVRSEHCTQIHGRISARGYSARLVAGGGIYVGLQMKCEYQARRDSNGQSDTPHTEPHLQLS